MEYATKVCEHAKRLDRRYHSLSKDENHQREKEMDCPSSESFRAKLDQ